MCDVMMTLVSVKTRLKTQGLFDPREVCAGRGQTVVCGHWKKTTNEEGTKLVYSVFVMYILLHVENLEYIHSCSTADACLKAVSCHHLSAVIVHSIRSTHVRTTISHIQKA